MSFGVGRELYDYLHFHDPDNIVDNSWIKMMDYDFGFLAVFRSIDKRCVTKNRGWGWGVFIDL
jgi:hypothetical protein